MKNQGRFGLLIENFIVYGGAATLSKIIPFIMLPIVTRILNSTEEYGIYEIFSTIVSLGCVFANMSMGSGVFREYFEVDSEKDQKKIISSSIILVTSTALTISLLCSAFAKTISTLYFGTDLYITIVILAAIAIFFQTSFYIWSTPIRIDNNKKIFVITNILQSVLFYLIAILLLNNNFKSYALIIGTIGGTVVSTIISIFYSKKKFGIQYYDKDFSKKMLSTSLPLILGAAIYWIFGSLDRIMITHIMDLNSVGIYSIGAKVASVAGIVYTAFGNGWQYFSFSTMKDQDQVEMTSTIFEVLTSIVTITFLLSMTVYKPFFEIVFEGDYVKGYLVFPYLFVSPLLLMLYQSVANQFIIVRKSFLSTCVLIIGCVVNIVLNYCLIPLIGIKGASIATIIGYTVTICITIIMLSRMKLLKISYKTITCFLVIGFGFIVIEFFKSQLLVTIYAILALFSIICIYNKVFKMILRKVKQ